MRTVRKLLIKQIYLSIFRCCCVTEQRAETKCCSNRQMRNYDSAQRHRSPASISIDIYLKYFRRVRCLPFSDTNSFGCTLLKPNFQKKKFVLFKIYFFNKMLFWAQHNISLLPSRDTVCAPAHSFSLLDNILCSRVACSSPVAFFQQQTFL